MTPRKISEYKKHSEALASQTTKAGTSGSPSSPSQTPSWNLAAPSSWTAVPRCPRSDDQMTHLSSFHLWDVVEWLLQGNVTLIGVRPSTHPNCRKKSVPPSASGCLASSHPSISSSTGPSQRSHLSSYKYTNILSTWQKLVCIPIISVSSESKETEQKICLFGR